MLKAYVIANQVVNEKLAQSALFTIDEIDREILKRGGILRVSDNHNIEDHKNVLLSKGLIELVKQEGQENLTYQATPIFANLINANQAIIKNGLKADVLIDFLELKFLLE